MNCPVCNVQLNVSDRSGIEIDYCPRCRGVWLDRGELDKIIERSASRWGDNRPDLDNRDNRRWDDDDDYRNDPRYNRRDRDGFLDRVFDIFH